jgi:sulfotransferase family protein
MITWLASYPRSGNTYLRTLLHHYHGTHTHHIYYDVAVNDEERSVAEMTGGRPRPMPIPEMAAARDNFFVKTHELPADDFPALYLVRDGRDALISYAHFILRSRETEEGRPIEDRPDAFRQTLHDLIHYKASFGGWSAHVLAWTGRSVPTAVIKFEELVSLADPFPIVHKTLQAIGCNLGAPVRTSAPPTFARLQERSSRMFRRGKIGAWRSEMPPDLVELFWKENRLAMERMGYVLSD